jgi:hypothetical protein
MSAASTTAAAQQPWDRAAGRLLSQLLGMQPGPGPQIPCSWALCSLPNAHADEDAAAWLLAEHSLRIRMGSATQLFDLWRNAAVTGTALAGTDRKKVMPFIQSGYGEPSSPMVEDHLQGQVAELAWYVLASEATETTRTLRRIEKPSFRVTSPGPDGLTVYELPDGSLAFRVWEAKKHTGRRHLSITITRACSQLSSKGAEYLAQYVSLAPEAEPELADLYSRLVDLWVDEAPEAGVGVAIATSHTQAPRRKCFGGMQRHFPGLIHSGQLEGMVAAIADFPTFCHRVRGFVWRAL